MNAPVLRARLDTLLERRDKIDAEIAELRSLLEQRRIVTPSGRRSRHDVPECGSESAYQRHRYFGEDADDACRAAHASHERVAAARRRMERLMSGQEAS